MMGKKSSVYSPSGITSLHSYLPGIYRIMEINEGGAVLCADMPCQDHTKTRMPVSTALNHLSKHRDMISLLKCMKGLNLNARSVRHPWLAWEKILEHRSKAI